MKKTVLFVLSVAVLGAGTVPDSFAIDLKGAMKGVAGKKAPPAAAAAASTPAGTHAAAVTLTAEQKTKLAGWQAAVNDQSATEFKWPMEMCGMKTPLLIKLDPSIAEPFATAGNEANFYCQEVRDKISTICRNAADTAKRGNKVDNKALINKLINRITCKGIKEPEDNATFSIQGGELTATLGGKASNVAEKLLEYLYKSHRFNQGELN